MMKAAIAVLAFALCSCAVAVTQIRHGPECREVNRTEQQLCEALVLAAELRQDILKTRREAERLSAVAASFRAAAADFAKKAYAEAEESGARTHFEKAAEKSRGRAAILLTAKEKLLVESALLEERLYRAARRIERLQREMGGMQKAALTDGLSARAFCDLLDERRAVNEEISQLLDEMRVRESLVRTERSYLDFLRFLAAYPGPAARKERREDVRDGERNIREARQNIEAHQAKISELAEGIRVWRALAQGIEAELTELLASRTGTGRSACQANQPAQNGGRPAAAIF